MKKRKVEEEVNGFGEGVYFGAKACETSLFGPPIAGPSWRYRNSIYYSGTWWATEVRMRTGVTQVSENEYGAILTEKSILVKSSDNCHSRKSHSNRKRLLSLKKKKKTCTPKEQLLQRGVWIYFQMVIRC